MEPVTQPPLNSNSNLYLLWKYRNNLLRIVLGGLAWLLFEYYIIRILDVPNNYKYLLWELGGFLVSDLIVVFFIILLPTWQESKSLKTASLACGCCSLAFLTFLHFLAVLATTIFIHSSFPYNPNINNIHSFNWLFATSIVQIPLLVLSLILSAIGLELGLADDRKRNSPNHRTGEAAQLSRISLMASFVFMFPACFLLILVSGALI